MTLNEEIDRPYEDWQVQNEQVSGEQVPDMVTEEIVCYKEENAALTNNLSNYGDNVVATSPVTQNIEAPFAYNPPTLGAEMSAKIEDVQPYDPRWSPAVKQNRNRILCDILGINH